ncbi:MAG: amidohydrolase family protein, partial [Rhodoluna sp.]
MATKFFGGTIYLGNHSYTDCLYVDDAGLVASKETWGESPNKVEVNLDGAFIAPAFRDAHAHPLFAGRESLGADISGLDSIEEIGAKLLEYSKSKKQLAWLDAASYDRNLAGQLTRRALDAFVSEIPVVLHAEDHHTLWVNSKALEIAGLLDGELPVLTEGGIDLDEQGLPTGILREWQAMQLVLSKAPKQTITEDVEALLNAEKMLLAAGIIEVQDAWIERGMAEVYLAAEEQLQIDYKLAFRVDAATFDNDFEYASE